MRPSTLDGGHMFPRPRLSAPNADRPPMTPAAAAVIDCARDLAWITHGNTSRAVYVERRDAFARLRGALQEFDRQAHEDAA